MCLPHPAGGGGAALRKPAHREGVGPLYRRRGHDGGSQRVCGADGEPCPRNPRLTPAPPCPACFWKAMRGDPQAIGLPHCCQCRTVAGRGFLAWGRMGSAGAPLWAPSSGAPARTWEWGCASTRWRSGAQGWRLWRGAPRRSPEGMCGPEAGGHGGSTLLPRAGGGAEHRGLCTGAGHPWRLIGVVLVSRRLGHFSGPCEPVRAGPLPLVLVTRGAGQPSVVGAVRGGDRPV